LSDAAPIEDLADLYETAPCGYVSVSRDGRVVKINRTLCDWIGRPADSIVGTSVLDLMSFGGRIAYETHLAPLLRMQGHVYEIALDLLQSDGAMLPVIANAAEKRDSAGGHQFTRLTLFRAVDRRTYERSLVEARVNAEAASKAEQEVGQLREQFIAVLGHDLRNPITAVTAGIGMLERHEHLSEKGRAVLKGMSASVERAAGLIEDVLDFARGRLGQGISIDRVAGKPLAPLLQQVVTEVRAIVPDREIIAEIDIEGPVHCDSSRIGQLASNLLSNAVTHGAPDRPVRFDARAGDGRLVIWVANAGPAIPEEVRAQLFQPFVRGTVRASRNGLGLGLFIAGQIAKGHGGTLDVSSTEEETRFTFVMPLKSEGQPADQ
jgi:sigma-B regulation protein RsbU (phosphoserine phosphatase)